MLMLTTSGISRHQSRTTLNLSRSHAGSAMILTATDMSSERANSSASKFSETASSNRFAKLHAVLGLNERNVVHDENAGLANLFQFLDGALRCFYPVIASVERPCTAKDAVPRTAPAKLDGSRRVQLADEILAAMLNQVARGQQMIERMHKRGRRTAMVECYAARDIFQACPTLRESLKQASDRRFTFTDQHAIHCARSVPQNFFRNKRNTVSTNTNECFRQ